MSGSLRLDHQGASGQPTPSVRCQGWSESNGPLKRTHLNDYLDIGATIRMGALAGPGVSARAVAIPELLRGFQGRHGTEL